MGDLRLPPNKVRIPNALNSQYVRPPSLDHVIPEFWPLPGDIYRPPGHGSLSESREGPFMEDFHERALESGLRACYFAAGARIVREFQPVPIRVGVPHELFEPTG